MRKSMISLFASLFLFTGVTGCSFLQDKVNAVDIAKDMDKIVVQSNSTEDLNKKVQETMDEYTKIMSDKGIAPKEAIKKGVPLIDKAALEAKAYSEAVKKVQAELPKVTEATTKFKDAETKKLADKFVADFTALANIKVEYSASQEAALKEMKIYTETAAKGIKPTNEAAGDAAVKKMEDLDTQHQQLIDQFNKSWEEFNKKVTGNKVQ